MKSASKHTSISPPLLFVLLLSLMTSGLFLMGLRAQSNGQLKDNPARGVRYQGMVLGTSDIGCADAFRIELESGPICTHGPDPAPEGVDVRISRDVEDTETSYDDKAFVKPASVSCTGDGQSGNRVQLIYAHAADVTDRYDQFASSFQDWAQNINRIVTDSAAKTGGTSQVRYVHDSQCVPSIVRVQLSATGDDTFGNTINELIAAGHNRNDRKYLIWSDANIYCGIATIRYDDRVGQENNNNRGQSYARTDNGCWGFTSSVEAHELVHNLGGVQTTAPNSDGEGHCSDEYDRLCYDAGAGVAMRYVCSNTNERLLDCNNDDYFSASPPSGNYLATHWNTAKSSFMQTESGSSPPSYLNLQRMYYPAHNKHFWTLDTSEKNNLTTRSGFVYEGQVHFNVCSAGTPVLRLVNLQGKHFWTTSTDEAHYLIRGGFILEGVAFYACENRALPTYRLYHFQHNKHFWTSSVLEKDSLNARGFTVEGVVW